MKNKKIIISFVIASLISVLVLPCTLLITPFIIPTQFDDTYVGELPYKVKRLKENKDKKKIVIIGGSSVPFSIRSSLIEENLKDYKVIDFGLYASLGTKVMLDLAKPYIQKDDIVILYPETHSQTLSLYFDALTTWEAIDGNYNLFFEISNDNKMEMISSIPNFASEKYKYYNSSEKPKTDDIYMRSSFDEYGDISSTLSTCNTMDNLYDKTTLINFDSSILDNDFINYVNNYSNDINKKGAKMYYRFAPMNELAITNKDNLDNFYNALDSKLNFSILGNPNDSILNALWFYDTNFHLNNSGAILNTYNLIKEIKLELKDDSKTEIEIPSMPNSQTKDFVVQDNSDIECFNIEEKENECVITSLKEEGSNKESLIIPSTYNDKPIRSFDVNTFKNSNVKRITIQDNITELFDGCFYNIKEVILTNSSPSKIKVGYDLFKNSNAKIYVNNNDLSKYKTNYSWSKYSNYIYSVNDLNQ